MKIPEMINIMIVAMTLLMMNNRMKWKDIDYPYLNEWGNNQIIRKTKFKPALDFNVLEEGCSA